MTGTNATMRLEIKASAGRTFKSIDSLVWEGIPKLAIITGVNGTGKTHLLELLAYKLAGVPHPDVGVLNWISAEVDGDKFSADEVAYVPNHWQISGHPQASAQELINWKAVTYGHVRNAAVGSPDLRSAARRARFARVLGKPNLPSGEEFQVAMLPDDPSFAFLDAADVTAGLAEVFLSYRFRAAELREATQALEPEIRKEIGPPPWEILNDAFRTAGSPFQVNRPEGPLLDSYVLMFHDGRANRSLRPADLSSGERVILGGCTAPPRRRTAISRGCSSWTSRTRIFIRR